MEKGVERWWKGVEAYGSVWSIVPAVSASRRFSLASSFLSCSSISIFSLSALLVRERRASRVSGVFLSDDIEEAARRRWKGDGRGWKGMEGQGRGRP